MHELSGYNTLMTVWKGALSALKVHDQTNIAGLYILVGEDTTCSDPMATGMAFSLSIEPEQYHFN